MRKPKNSESNGKSGPGAGRIYRLEVLLNEEDKRILDELRSDTGICRSELVRIALRKLSKTVINWNIPKK